MQHCSITSDFTSTSHIHNWVLFLLWLDLFILSWAISPLISIDLGSSSFSVFLPFHALHGLLKAKILKWFAIPFSSVPRFIRTKPSWAALPNMAHSFIELDKAVIQVISLVNFLVSILSAFWWIRIRGLWKLPDGRDLLWEELGLPLMGRAILSKSLMKFSIDG